MFDRYVQGDKNHDGYKQVDFKRRTFDDAEYSTLREEMIYRINVAYGHGFTLISVVLIYFSAIFLFIPDILSFAMEENSVFGQSMWFDFVFVFAIAASFTVPVFIVYAFSVRYEDNLRQICNLAAFQKVFHEFPSMLKSDDADKKIKAWELLHCNSNIPKAKVIALEYVAISVTSAVLSFFTGVLLAICISMMNSEFRNDPFNFGAVICFFSILMLALVIVASLCIGLTHKNTNGVKIIKKYSEKYTERYIKTALMFQLLSEDEEKEFTDLYGALNEWDRQMTTEMAKRKAKWKQK